MRDKIKVLFLASDPFEDRAPLRLDEEARAIRQAIERGTARDTLDLVPLFAVRTRDLQEALLRHQPHVVHFAGHGRGSGEIILGDEDSRPQPVGKEALARLFGLLNHSVKAVILNGCDTLPIVAALGEVVDYAIGMNRPITDASALAFAQAFYVALAMGQPLRTSFDLAVNQLQLEGSDESATPVLRVRSGVDPAAPLIAPPPAKASPASSPASTEESGGADMVNRFGTFDMDEAEFDNTRGSGRRRMVNQFDDRTGKRFPFRN